MLNDFLLSIRYEAYKLLYIQIALVLLVAIFWLFYQNVTASWSAVMGGVAWVIPSIYFIRKCFTMPQHSSSVKTQRLQPEQKSQTWSQTIVGNFFLAEMIKLLLSGILIVLFIKFLPLKVLPFLSGYVFALMSIWFMPYASSTP